MSAQLKTAKLDSSVIKNRIIEDTQLGPTAIVDVVQGSGTLYAIEIDASAANVHQYRKLKLTTSDVTVGTTEPDIVIMCAAQKKFTHCIPAGLSFTSLSAWLTTSQAVTATTNSENAAQRYTIARFITI